jgi:hypothetical protein
VGNLILLEFLECSSLSRGDRRFWFTSHWVNSNFLIVTLLRLFTLGLKETSKMKAACRCYRMTPKNQVLGRVCPMAGVKNVISAVQHELLLVFSAYLVTLCEDDMSPFLALLFLVYSVFDRVLDPEWVNIFSAWSYSASDWVTSARVGLTHI